MEAIFDGLNFNQKVFMVILMISSITMVGYFLFRWLSNKKVSVNVKRGQLSYKGDSTPEDTVNIVAKGVFLQTLETVTLMTHIKTKLIMHDQMTYLEERLVLIRDTILESYREKLKEELSKAESKLTTVASNQDYLFFQSLVDLMKEDMKRSARGFFLRNNFSQLTEEELSAYISEKNELLIVKATEFLRDLYPSDKMIVPFESVHKGLNEVKADLEVLLSQVFKKAVVIYKVRHNQIDDLEKSLRDKIKATYGVDLEETGSKIFSSALKAGS